MKKFAVLCAVLLLLVASTAFAAERFVNPEGAPKAIEPYTHAVWAGDMLFLSGLIGLDPETNKVVEGGTLAEAAQIFKNMQLILNSQDLGFEDVVKVKVFGTDIREFRYVNALYVNYFSEPFPARAFVEAAALPAGALIKLDVIAYRGETKFVNPETAPEPIGPYSHAVWAGDVLFLAGQIALDETNTMVRDGTLAEAVQVFTNIATILHSQDLDFEDIVKVTVFGTDIREFPYVNRLYITYFDENFPARAFVEASALPASALIELDVIAYRGDLIFINPETAPAPIGPYSHAVWAGDLLFLAGQIALDETNTMVRDGTMAEAKQVFRNIEIILHSQDMDFSDVVKVIVYGVDVEEFPEFNELYATFFPENPPARSSVQATALPAGARIELDVIAYRAR